LTPPATYYATGLGACGITNTDTDYIAAVSHLMFDTWPGWNGANPNNNPICGKKIRANCECPRARQHWRRLTPMRARRQRQRRDDHCHRPLHGLRDHRPRLLPERVLPARGPGARPPARDEVELDRLNVPAPRPSPSLPFACPYTVPSWLLAPRPVSSRPRLYSARGPWRPRRPSLARLCRCARLARRPRDGGLEGPALLPAGRAGGSLHMLPYGPTPADVMYWIPHKYILHSLRPR
jgi:hypothetical protein